VVGGLVVAYLAPGPVYAPFPTAEKYGWLAGVAMFALQAIAMTCGYLVFRRRGHAVWLLVAAATAATVAESVYEYTATGAFFMVAWLAPMRLRPVPALLVAGGAILGWVGSSYVSGLPWPANLGIAFALMWSQFFGALVNQLNLSRSQAGALAEAGVLAERQRLAREIHDVLAHSLSAQVVHLEGTRMLLENGARPDQVLARVTAAGEMARVGLEEAKRAVAALRSDPTPLATQLEALAAEFRSLTGKPCQIHVSGGADSLPAEARLAVLRTAQEALTNVRKHSPGASVVMTLHQNGKWRELEVVDSGGTSSSSTGNGYGLVGMRERAELIGGTLAADRTDGGFRVRLQVPA
jgi:signal transduction histidine kinase